MMRTRFPLDSANNDMNINLRHLQAFLVVAETGSISKAAETLYRATYPAEAR